MGSEDTTELNRQVHGRGIVDWRPLLLATVLGALGGASGSVTVPLLAPEVVRPSPFTAEDAAQLARQVRLEMRESLYSLCSRMPPARTRSRIAKLEGWASQRDALFVPGDLQWGDSDCSAMNP